MLNDVDDDAVGDRSIVAGVVGSLVVFLCFPVVVCGKVVFACGALSVVCGMPVVGGGGV